MIRNKIKDFSKDYELFFVLFFTWTYIVGAILGLTRHYLKVGILDIGFLDLLLLVFFLNVSGVFSKRLRSWPITASIILLFLLLVGTLFSSEMGTNLSVMGDIIVTCLPLMILGSCVRDYKKVYDYLVWVMFFFVIFSSISFYLFGASLDDDQHYSQSEAYRMLLPAIVLLFDTFEHFSLKSFLSFLICVFLIIAYGARGPLLAVAVFLLLYLALSLKRHLSRKTKLSLIFFSALLIFAVFKYGNSFYLLAGVLDNMSMSTRTVTMITDGSLMEDEARGQLAEISIRGIKENPILGVGLVNDRNYITPFFHSDEDNTGRYPHNVFLEVLLQFGLLFGTILIIVFFRLIFKSYKDAKDDYLPKLILILFSVNFVPLLYSGSYLTQEGLYVLLAFCISSIKQSTMPILNHAN